MGEMEFRAWFDPVAEASKGLVNSGVLSMYAPLLEMSESTDLKGVDVYHLLVGAINILTRRPDFPGPNPENFIGVVQRVQRIQKSDGLEVLDLGVCEFLDYSVDGQMRARHFVGMAEHKRDPFCLAGGGSPSDLSVCIPPKRCDCGYRKRALEEEVGEVVSP